MKKNYGKILAVICIMVISFAFAGCSKESSEKNSLEKIIEKGILVVGTEAQYAPYEFIMLDKDGNQSFVGIDMFIAEEIANQLGVKLEIIDMDFDGLIPALQAGQIDMALAGISPKEDRKLVVDFTDIYYKSSQSVVIRKADIDIYNTVSSFENKLVGAQKGSLQETLLTEQLIGAEPFLLPKIPNLILELKANNIEGCVIESPVALKHVQLDKDGALAIANIELTEETDGSAIAVAKDSPELVAEINKIIAEMISTGKMDQYVEEASILYDSLFED